MPKLAAPYSVRDVSASRATSFDTKIVIGMGSGGPQKPEGNYYRCSNGYTGTNADFDPYNVYYNGSLTLEWTGTPPCTPYTAPRNGSLAIGKMILPEKGNISRAPWDSNPYYFSFFSPEKFDNCSKTISPDCAPNINVYSSVSTLYWSQVNILLLCSLLHTSTSQPS
jgi:hypothetical protein